VITLDVTNVFRELAPMDYSASRIEFGEIAGVITWCNACEDALTAFGDQFDREAFDDYFRQWGAWSDEEIAAHSDAECAALMLQFIMGDAREAECDNAAFGSEDFDWARYNELSQAGTVPSSFYRGDDGRIYFEVHS
jgi:hypothetical protein